MKDGQQPEAARHPTCTRAVILVAISLQEFLTSSENVVINESLDGVFATEWQQ